MGDGEERTSLQTAVDENGLTNDVSFVGFQNNPYAYIKQADVFVLSSLYEGFGNVLVEALAAGTTIVSTDCPSGPREILAEGAYGHIVPVGDPVELAHAMEKALLQPMEPETLQRRAAAFTVNACADQYERLFKTRPNSE